MVKTRGRTAYFVDLRIVEEMMNLLGAQEGTIAGCLMPEHLHWLVSDLREMTARVARFKSLSTRLAWRYGHHGSIWQRSFWDRVVRGEQDLRRTLRYVTENPWLDDRCTGSEELRVIADNEVIQSLLYG